MAVNDDRLHMASRDNDVDLVERLLSWRANVNHTDEYLQTPLILACSKGHSGVVEKLLKDKNIDVNKKNYIGLTALNCAMGRGHVDCVKLLRYDKRVDWTETDDLGFTSNFYASLSGSWEIIEIVASVPEICNNLLSVYSLLTLSFPVLYLLFWFMFLLTQAVRVKNAVVKQARYFYRMIKHINRLLSSPSSPRDAELIKQYSKQLFVACRENDLATVEFALARDADVNFVDVKRSLTPLMVACSGGFYEIVSLLLQHTNLLVNKTNSDGMSALHFAVEKGHISSVCALKLNKNVNWNLKDKLGRVPIRDAIFYGNIELVKTILSVPGLDLTPKGTSLVSLASRWRTGKPGLYEIVTATVRAGKEGRGRTLYLACRDNQPVTLDFMISQHANVNYVEPRRSFTPLMQACARGHPGIVQRLLQVEGIEVNRRSRDGCTAVHYAIYSNHLECVQTLTNCGELDWNVRNNEGYYPVTIAIRNENIQILKIILSVTNIDLSVEGPEEGESLLSYASVKMESCPVLYEILTATAVKIFKLRNEELRRTNEKFGAVEKSKSEFAEKMKQIENLMKTNEKTKPLLDKKEKELLELNITSEEMFDQHAREMRRIIEEIENNKNTKQNAEAGLLKLRQNIEICRKNISELKKKRKKKINTERKIDNLQFQKKDMEEKLDLFTSKCVQSEENIYKLTKEKKTCEELMDEKMIILKTYKNALVEEIDSLKCFLSRNCKSVDDLMKAGAIRSDAIRKELANKLEELLGRMIDEKEESIREKEDDLACPVCLEIADCPIYCCHQQHLICGVCRPKVKECPECRDVYTLEVRHRYAEKIALELKKLYTELDQLKIEMNNLSK